MPTGIKNIGMTCYMDSLAQAILACPALKDSLIAVPFFNRLMAQDIEAARRILIGKNFTEEGQLGDSAETLMRMMPDKSSASGVNAIVHTCNSCNHVQVATENYSIFLINRLESTRDGIIELFEMICDERECEECKKTVKTTHQVVAGFVPQTLILNVTGENFDFVADDGLMISGDGFDGPKRLRSMVCHNMDHYVAYVLEDDYWYRCDGPSIVKVAFASIPAHLASLLFYE